MTQRVKVRGDQSVLGWASRIWAAKRRLERSVIGPAYLFRDTTTVRLTRFGQRQQQ